MREFNKERFKTDFEKMLLLETDKRPEECTDEEAMDALTRLIVRIASDAKVKTTQRHIEEGSKRCTTFPWNS